MEIHPFLWESVHFFFSSKLMELCSLCLQNGPQALASSMWFGTTKPHEESDRISSLSSLPTALIHPHPREGHILHLEACRSTGRYQ